MTNESKMEDCDSKTTQYKRCYCKKLNEKNATKIPRPRNAFIMYRQSEEHSYPITMKAVDKSRLIASRWKSLPSKERMKWIPAAEEERQAHKLKYPNYQYYKSKKANHKAGIERTICDYCKNKLNDHSGTWTESKYYNKAYHILDVIDLNIGPNNVRWDPAPRPRPAPQQIPPVPVPQEKISPEYQYINTVPPFLPAAPRSDGRNSLPLLHPNTQLPMAPPPHLPPYTPMPQYVPMLPMSQVPQSPTINSSPLGPGSPRSRSHSLLPHLSDAMAHPGAPLPHYFPGTPYNVTSGSFLPPQQGFVPSVGFAASPEDYFREVAPTYPQYS